MDNIEIPPAVRDMVEKARQTPRSEFLPRPPRVRKPMSEAERDEVKKALNEEFGKLPT